MDLACCQKCSCMSPDNTLKSPPRYSICSKSHACIYIFKINYLLILPFHCVTCNPYRCQLGGCFECESLVWFELCFLSISKEIPLPLMVFAISIVACKSLHLHCFPYYVAVHEPPSQHGHPSLQESLGDFSPMTSNKL